MATNSLWWNGSEWKTTDSYWLNGNSRGSLYSYVDYEAKIIAYAGAGITPRVDFYAKVAPNPSAAWFPDNSHKDYKVNDVTVITLNNNTRSTTVDVTERVSTDSTTKFSYHNTLAVRYVVPNVGSQAGNAWTGEGSTNISYPFVTVSYNANGGSGAPSSHLVCKGASCSLSSTVPTRTNHTFLGWATSSSAHVQDYESGGDITTSGDITLYAVWGPAIFIDVDEGTTISLNSVSYTNETTVVQNLVWGNSYPITTTANTGYIVKTQSHPDGTLTINADETDVSATGQRVGCHIDDGEEWVQAVMYYDDGTGWHMVQAYYDNGNSWELVY